MTDLVIVLVLLVAAAGARWLLGNLRTVPTSARSEPASISVVIPARNEEATVVTLLASLRECGAELCDIVVVDDGSEDATVSVARAGGARVVPAGAPPPGWTGKAWACHVGAYATSGRL